MIPSSLRQLSIPLLSSLLLGGCALPAADAGRMHTVAPGAAEPALADPPAVRTAHVVTDRVRELSRRIAGQRIAMLGEVHDNPAGHALRLQALEMALETQGWRPAIAMEQFDRENQPLLTRAQATCTDADCVIAMASPDNHAWQWEYYKPLIAWALRERLPLLAANLSRASAGRVMQAGLGSVFYTMALRDLGLEFGAPAAVQQAQEQEVADGHCGMLPPAMHAGMARAQIARDAMMAQVIKSVQDRPVVLIAGNGHVRRDLGVARWLGDASAYTVGFVEQAAPAGRYDRAEIIPAQARPDPCASIKPRAPAPRPN